MNPLHLFSKIALYLAATVMCLLLLSATARATTYYIDSVAGSESNNGTSTSTPWQSIASTAKVNSTTFLPGDSILFKRGSSWTGNLIPKGSGTSTAPIVFDAYGTGAAPIINGGGAAQAIILWNKNYVTLQNFEILNDGTSDASRAAIRLNYVNPGVFSGVKILNNDIHNVRGYSDTANMYDNAAIFINITDENGFTRVDSLLIQGNDIHDIKTIGIYQRAPENYGTHPELWATNMVIRGNTFDKTGDDHIIIMGANAPLIESNAGYDAGINGAGYGYIAGMWSSYFCKDAVFQYNEVARMHNELAPTGGDGQAFDCDKGATGTNIFQYNYTHDNKGGVLLMMQENVAKTVIYRYNLSVDDDRQTYSGCQLNIRTWPGTNAAYVYNNVFYTTLGVGYKMADFQATYYYNNIFNTPAAIYPSLPTFSNNCYFGHAPDVTDPYKVLADPKFVGPLPTTAGGDGYVAANTDIFKLQSTSPCINWGKSITAPVNNGGFDFWGNPLYAGTYADIGMHEVVGGSNPPPAPVTFTDDAPSTPVVYTGTGWSNQVGDTFSYNSTRSVSNTLGNYVEYTFTGTNVSLFGKRGIAEGKISATIDGGAATVVDCYWPVDLTQVELFKVAGLTNQSHKLRLTVAAKNPYATGNYIVVDYFKVEPGTPATVPVVTTVDNPASASVVYNGAWTAVTGDTYYYGGTRANSSTVGAYVDYTFNGTGVRLYGTKALGYGKLSIAIDGGAAMLVNCYEATVADHLVKLYDINGLASGTHHLVATVATKDAASSGNAIALDFFQTLVGGASAPADVIMDNTDATGVTLTGTWSASTATAGYYGTNYIHDNNTGQGTKSVQFTPTLPVAGNYQVFVWWTAATNRATNVPIDIITSSGTTTVQVNQQFTGGQWVSLGTYSFNAGTTGSVLIRNTAANGFVIADAVRFLKP